MTKNDQKPSKYAFLEIFCAIFSAKKSARRMRSSRNHLELPQSTPRKPQQPRRTFFSAENGLKMTKNDQKPSKYAFFEIFCAIFSAKKKCAEGAHTPKPLETTSSHTQKASGTPAHFLFGPNGLKMAKNDQKPPKHVFF